MRRALLAAGIPFRNPVIDTHALAAELARAGASRGPSRSAWPRSRASSASRSTAPTTRPATC